MHDHRAAAFTVALCRMSCIEELTGAAFDGVKKQRLLTVEL